MQFLQTREKISSAEKQFLPKSCDKLCVTTVCYLTNYAESRADLPCADRPLLFRRTQSFLRRSRCSRVLFLGHAFLPSCPFSSFPHHINGTGCMTNYRLRHTSQKPSCYPTKSV